MRKNFTKILLTLGVAALILPSVASAEWVQTDTQESQGDHWILISTIGGLMNGDNAPFDLSTLGGMEHQVGYAYGINPASGDTVTTNTNPEENGFIWGAPSNTTPCPLGVDTGTGGSWETSMGNCPSQVSAANGDNQALAQTAPDLTISANLEREANIILDDLYASVSDSAKVEHNASSEVWYKNIDQELDVLFYLAPTTWVDPNGDSWVKGLGIDQTLDQDVADIAGTSVINADVKLAGEHLAQYLYQDFRGWNGTINGTDAADTSADGFPNKPWIDQWVIQSMVETYSPADMGGSVNGEWTGTGYSDSSTVLSEAVALRQSYSSWYSIGTPVEICTGTAGDEVNPGAGTGCSYDYNKVAHEISKTVTAETGAHQTAP